VSEREIQDWLVSFVADLLAVADDEIDVRMPWDSLGVDSATTLVIAAELGDVLERELSPTEVLDQGTIESLAAHLSAAEPVGV
jgi:acyl carrier protein